MKRSFIALMLVLLSAIVWMVWGGRSKLPPSQRLPDGTVVSVTKIYCGKTVVIPKGKKWQRMAAKILPITIAERLGVAETITFSSNATFIFVESHRTNGFPRSFGGATTSPTPYFRASVRISDGGHDKGFWPTDAAISNYGNTTNTEVEVFRIPRVSHVISKVHVHLTRRDYLMMHDGWPDDQSVDFIVPYPTANSKSP